jgi:signal transduction histidine kinase
MTRRMWGSPWTFVLIIVGASAAALAVALFAVDRIGESIIDQQANAAAKAEERYMITLAREEGLAALVDTLNRREHARGGAGFRYALTDAQGRPMAGVPAFNGMADRGKGWKIIVSHDRGKRRVWHVLVDTLPTGQSLFIAQDAEQRREFRLAIIQASGVALVCVTLATTLAGLLLGGYLLRRVRDISRTAERIAAGDLNARIAVAADGDVFDRLGTVLNAMLSRIQELMTGMRTVTDSLAHDLRKPLTRVQIALDNAVSPNVSPEGRNNAIATARQYTESALATFSALLDVARAESGLSAEMMSELDLPRLLADVAELFEPMFEDAKQSFALDVPGDGRRIRAHGALLRQAVGNLLHNAATHAGAGAAITLCLLDADGGQDVVVSDNGPGIAASDRGKVTERFVRLDTARSTPGSGLGLAIAAACAKLHGGSLVLEDNEPGLRVRLQLRSAAPS